MIQPCPAGCKMIFRGIRGSQVYPHELWQCPECGREAVKPYSGTPETVGMGD